MEISFATKLVKHLRPLKTFVSKDPGLSPIRDGIATYGGVLRPLGITPDDVIVDGNKMWHILMELDPEMIVPVFVIEGISQEKVWAVHAILNNTPYLRGATDIACDAMVSKLIEQIQVPVFFQTKQSSS